jgi:RNA polymerase sigma factor (sigma-70 family)
VSENQPENLDGRKTEEDSVGRFLLKYHNSLYQFALRRVRNHAIADDLVQRALEKMIPRLRDHRLNLKSENQVLAWLYRVIRNETISFFRTLTKIEANPEVLAALPAAPEKAFRDDYVDLVLHRAFEKLSAEDRDLIMQREDEGLTYPEIAKRRGQSRGTIRRKVGMAMSRMAIILRQIAPDLAEEFGDA